MAPPTVSSPDANLSLPRSPARFREWFEERGPVYIKIGQFLALRPDLIPQAYCDELLHLFDRAPEFPWEDARRIIREDLGADPEQLFAWIDPRPLAAASLAQVHVAFTHAGDPVCVKVQREGVHQQIEEQLGRPHQFKQLMEATGAALLVSPRELMEEFGAWMKRELDFAMELQALVKMHELYGSDRHVRVPRPFPELSGARVVTSEYLKGTPFTTLLTLIKRGDEARIAALGIDVEKLATNLIVSVLKQIFDRRLFHADPHPGNLIAMSDNRVGFVDFGLVDRLDEASLQQMTRYLTAIYSGDVERMYYALRQFLVAGEHANFDKFHDAFVEQTRAMLREPDEERQRKLGERSPFAQYLVAVVHAARDNDLRIPPHLLSMYRTLITAESVAQHLGADVQVREIGRAFFAKLQFQNTAKAFDSTQAQAFGADLLALAKDSPALLHRLLSDLADERFLLHVRASQSREDQVEANRRARLVATSVVSLALSVLLVGAEHVPGIRSLPYAPVLGSLLAVVVVYFLLIWRRLA